MEGEIKVIIPTLGQTKTTVSSLENWECQKNVRSGCVEMFMITG